LKDDNILGKLYSEIMMLLRPKTLPFEVKLYETLDELPLKTMRPRHPMNTCQITALVGLQGTVKTAAYPTPMDIGFPQMPDYTLTDWSVAFRKSMTRRNP